MIAVADAIRRRASFSRCGTYRYRLERQWDSALPWMAFIGLNPSTADASIDDPTIRRCMGFATDWGFGGVRVLNLFAYRATYPRDLFAANDPVGPGNRRAIANALESIDTIVACWGNHGHDTRGARAIIDRYGDALYYLRRNQNGAPAHPLYLPNGLRLRRWDG